MSKICHKVHHLFSEFPQLRVPFDTTKIPQNGIYILFEKGEFAHEVKRIVRIGTHTGNNQLTSRLKQHFVKENKDRSIFRKNIGRAILNKDKDPFLEHWEIDLTTSKARKKYTKIIDFCKLQITEKRVTEYIQQNFSFEVFSLDEKTKRLCLGLKLISTVSLCDKYFPSKTWLGLYSPKVKIKESGLWLVNELYKDPLSDSDYELLRQLSQVRNKTS